MTTALAPRPVATRPPAGPFLITTLRPAAVARCRCGDLLGTVDGALVHIGCVDCPDDAAQPCPSPHSDCGIPEPATCAHQRPYCGDPELGGTCEQGFEDCCGCCSPWRACDDL